MLRSFGPRGPRLIEKHIRDVLEEMRPLLHMELARFELLRFETTDGIAVLRVEGDCRDCEMSAAMLIEGIATHLRQRVPEIREVRREEP